MYAIIDNNGTIHSGRENEVNQIWEEIKNSAGGYDRHIGSHEGDLKLIEIIDIWNG